MALALPFESIVRDAWRDYDASREIRDVADISARVSTNHVYRLRLADRSLVIAKLSYFGRFEHFRRDHAIINALATNLPAPYDDFLARSLVKGSELYVYRHRDGLIDAWVVFYRPVRVRERPPRRFPDDEIDVLAGEFARFHRACSNVRHTLPPSGKTGLSDVADLEAELDTPEGRFQFRGYETLIREHCDAFRAEAARLELPGMAKIPVFVDWNVGNFSLTSTGHFYSRWDYDWFRISSRMMDFYFIARLVSDRGDRTVFTYDVDVLGGERFVRFLRAYHEVFPLTRAELELLREVYRFFLLQYVVHDGRYFFHEIFATRLLAHALEEGLPSVARFDPEPLAEALGL